MLHATLVLGLLGIICAFGSMLAGVRMANELRLRGLPANPCHVRWMIFKYMAEYKRVTLQETGQVGHLYRICELASALAALFAIGAICFMFL